MTILKLQNAGTLNLLLGNQAFAEKKYQEAEQFYSKAVENYRQILPTERTEAVKKNLGAAFLNLSNTEITNDTPNKAIKSLQLAQEEGYNDNDFSKSLAAAYYNLGLEQKELGSIDEAITSFQEAKKLYDQNINVIYNLGLVLTAQGNYTEAQKEFAELIEFEANCNNKNLVVNAYCKIVECQLKLNINATSDLEKAVKYFETLDSEIQGQCSDDGSFIYSHLIATFLSSHDLSKVKPLLKAALNLDKEIISKLENSASYHYDNANEREAMIQLLTLVHFSDDILEPDNVSHIQNLLSSMFIKCGQDKNREELGDSLAIKALGEVDNLTTNNIDELFA